MRITNEMLVNNVLQNLSANESRIYTLTNQMSSGKSLSQMSDNPADASRVLSLQTNLSQTGQYLSNAGSAQDWLATTSSALQGVNQALLSAQQVATQGANATTNANDRQVMATEVNSLIGTVVQLGNTTYAGSYVFAGAQTDAAPFSSSGSTVTYANSDPASATASLGREISPGLKIQVNTVGHDPTTNSGIFDTVFSALTGLSQALQTNNSSAISSSITTLGNALQQLNQASASVGTRTNQVQAIQNQLTAQQTQLSQTLSTLANTDMAQASIDYTQATVVQQAGLVATSKALPPSLFDYIA